MAALGLSIPAELMTTAANASPRALSPASTYPQDFREQFLSCSLGSRTAILLPVIQLIEILNISPDQITPIPHLPSWVRGVYNWRGEVLWIVDLARLLGIESEPLAQRAAPLVSPALANSQVVVLQGQPVTGTGTWATLAVLVDQVGDLEWCAADTIQSPPAAAFTPTLARFLQGYWLKGNGDVFLCLSVETIFAAMPQANLA
ncbi:chemotaxis protein CheW [Prochlorothrix hollandica]|nr:chemotaxis protein CheW [Prochlorothrix hollandica]